MHHKFPYDNFEIIVKSLNYFVRLLDRRRKIRKAGLNFPNKMKLE